MKYNDDEFKKFIGDPDDGDGDTNTGSEDEFKIYAISKKMRFVSPALKECLSTYASLPEGDELKKVLKETITKLLDTVKESSNQIDFIILGVGEI